MLMILIPSLSLLITTWLVPLPILWTTTIMYSFLVALISLTLTPDFVGYAPSYFIFNIKADSFTTPLLVLTCWLLPLMILASQKHISLKTPSQQRLHLTLLLSTQVFLILSFSASDLMMFFVMFEAVLTPTLTIIACWGYQKNRLAAGIYFLFYTLIGSLPLLIGLISIYLVYGTLEAFMLPDLSDCLNYAYNMPKEKLLYTKLAPYHLNYMTSNGSKVLWVMLMLAFFLKTPLYGLHLWLPKAHTEAPIAGSMILAAVLLKLGGYGMIRISPMMEPLTKNFCYPFIVLALWGVIMTGLICLRQTDLKSLIAYSSVGHMGLVTTGILIQTQWGFSGAMVLMMAHGLTSSALFCLTNISYERTRTRTMILMRGLQILFPLMATWWFMTALANLAMPPLPNLTGELLILTSAFNWAPLSFIFMGLGALITAAYSLYIFLMTQRGPLPHSTLMQNPTHPREHLLMALHLFPLFMLIIKPTLISLLI